MTAKILLILLFLFPACNGNETQKKPPKVVKGVLDLRPVETFRERALQGWDFATDGSINLDGEWEFYWNELIEPHLVGDAYMHHLQDAVQYIAVPGNWNNFLFDEKPIGGQGFATYRLKVLLPVKNVSGLMAAQPNASIEEPLGLKLLDISTAFKLFVNGKLITEVGKVGKLDSEATPAYLPQVVSIPSNTESIDILFQVANFEHARGGLWTTIKIGNLKELQKLRENNLLIDLYLIGALSLMGVYHLGLFLQRTKDKSTLYFGLFCLTIAIRTSLFGEIFLYQVFPKFPWSIGVILNFLTLTLGVIIFLLFLYSLFPMEFPKFLKLAILGSMGLLSLGVLLLPPIHFTRALNIIQIVTLLAIMTGIYTILFAIYKKRLGAKTFLAGFAIFAAIMTNDILHSMGIIYTGYYVPFGFLIFIFSQAYFLSTRSSRAFNQVEEFTETLENKISEGVKEQQKFSQSLLELSKSKTIMEQGLESAIKEVTEICARTLKIGRCSIWMFNSKMDTLECLDLFIVNENKHEKSISFTSSEFTEYFQYFTENDFLSAANVYSHPGIMEFNESYHEIYNIQSALDAPIRSGGKLLGVISCEQVANQKEWSTEEKNFVSSLSNILASHFEANERQEAYTELTETKKEIEDINQFTHQVNALSNLNDIFFEISKYAYENYKITGTWLFLPDEKREYLYAYKAYSYIKLPDEQYNYLLNKKIPLKENEGGMLHKTFQRKKSFYLSKIPKFEFGIDREIVETLSLKSIIAIPLIRKEECVGIYTFSHIGNELKLSKTDIRKLTNLCSQIAGAIDTNHLLQQIEKAKDKALVAQQETENLNNFTKLINSTSDISLIFNEVYSYLKQTMGFNSVWTLLINKNTNTIYSDMNIAFSEDIKDIDSEYFKNFNMKLEPALGTLYQTYQTKIPLYIPDFKNTIPGTKNQYVSQYNGDIYQGSKTDIKILLKGKTISFVQIPLILQNEVIGILNVSAYNQKVDITNDEIDKLVRFGNQIAGVIKNAQLLKETEKAKTQADIEKENALVAQKETEKQKRETEELNKLIKSLNEDLDIKVIMKKVHEYVKKNYNIQYYGLAVVDGDKIISIDTELPEFLTEEEKFNINNFRTNLNESIGAHSFAFKTKKVFFIPDTSKRKSGLTKDELYIFDKTKLESLLIIPLILQNQPIGFLDLYNVAKMELSKEDITKLSILGEQLAGIIHGSNLFKEVQEEKEKAIVAMDEAESERQKSEKLLLNILPKDVAAELKEKGFAEPVLFENVSVMFTDFKGFTTIAEKLSPQELIKDLDACFVQFDKISERYNLEKLKTIGDSYMCAGGIPRRNTTHAIDCCLAAIEIQAFMNMMKKLKEEKGFPYWELRLGIHTGPLIAGVIGERKFAYDVWGDTVNTASRMESSGTPGKINISQSTYESVKNLFDCEYRGEVNAKNKGVVKMYYLERIRHEFSKDEEGLMPNGKFWEIYGG